MKKEITVRYRPGHSYDFVYKKTDFHCPGCGEKQVWKEDGDGGDFYLGEDYDCVSCGANFNIPHYAGGNEDHGYEGKQVLTQLREDE